jgi:iron complex transport system substrate-binding protein
VSDPPTPAIIRPDARPRVVSLLPSATEVLCRIEGGRDLLVGRSHECNFPAGLESLPMLTAQRIHATTSAAIDAEVRATLGTGRDGEPASGPRSLYTLDADRLRVLSLDPASFEDVLDDVLQVGEAVGLAAGAHRAMIELREAWWTAVDFVNPYLDGPEVAFIEWMKPLFVGGHWTPGMIRAAGGRCSLGEPGGRSRTVTPEDLLASMPDRVIICPCGFTIEQTRADLAALTSERWWPLLPAVQEGRVVIVDGDAMFNRPGPRLVEAFRWLVGWINDRPEVIPPGFPVEPLQG